MRDLRWSVSLSNGVRPAWWSWRYVAGLAAVAAVVLVAALYVGGGDYEPVPAALGDPGPLTGWGLPLTRLLADSAAVVAVGLLLLAAVLVPTDPDDRGRLVGGGARAMRTVSAAAGVAALTAVVETVLTFSDFIGTPPSGSLDPGSLWSFVTQTVQGRALFAQVLLLAAVAVAARGVARSGGALVLLVAAVLAVGMPALAGHSSASPEHMLAVSSLLVHVMAASLWIGGLGAVLLLSRRPAAPLPVAVSRFSALALWCAVAVAASGVANAAVRLHSPAELVTTGYGALLTGKTVAFVVLAGFGWWHRRGSLPALASGVRAAFVRLAAVEVAVMAATMGLAVGLTRGQPPVPTNLAPDQASALEEQIGTSVPPHPTPVSLVLGWHLDGFAVTVIALALALYLTGVRQLRRRGDRWPVGRTIAWVLGLLVAFLVTNLGIGWYSPLLFSVHMVQHMALNMIVPILLVLGAPVTLALRSLPARSGARTALLRVLHSRVVQVLAFAPVAAIIFLASLYGLYFSPLFGVLMSDHWGHLLMQLHFLLAGALFFWVLIGVDPGPRRPPFFLRMVLLFATIAAHAFFSITVMGETTPLAQDYYRALGNPYGISLLSDQHLGGAIAWGFGDAPVLLVLGALFVQWIREEERKGRAADRAADRAELLAARAEAAAEAKLAAMRQQSSE